MHTSNQLKKILGSFCAIAVLSQANPLLASETPPQPPPKDLFSIDAKVGAFFLLNSNARDLYGPVLPSFTLEGNANVYKGLTVWLDGSYIFGNGGNAYGWSHLNFIPLSLGLKYAYCIAPSMDFYAGAGPCYSFLITRDHSSYVQEKNYSNNWGFVAKSGFIYHCTQHLFVEGFANYVYQQFHFGKTSSDPLVYRTDAFLNGVEVGASFGYSF